MWITGQELQQGKYKLEKMLGVGGFGVTYLATEQPSGRPVAVKTLNVVTQNKPNFERAQEKFIKEAFRLSQCSHPHIVRVYDIFKEEKLWGMAMEYIAGENLKDYLEQKGVLSEEEGLSYIHQIGDALSFVHSQGFLHRDVKPQNIMLRSMNSGNSETYEAVLIDFGSAREFTTGKTETHTNVGTECFAPIEQYEKRARRGEFTDVYALAATLYNLLTGKRPCPSDFRDQGMELIPPKQHNPNLSQSINNSVLKGMELRVENRSQTVRDWLRLLSSDLSQFNLNPPEIVIHHNTFYPYTLSNISSSCTNISFDDLEKLLEAQRWRDADEITYRLMLADKSKIKRGTLQADWIDCFSCEHLQRIDRYWLRYSNGHFGFSVQLQILQEIQNQQPEKAISDSATKYRFYHHLRWRIEGNLVFAHFSLNAPLGHLPYRSWIFMESFPAFVKKLLACKLVN
jgi:eukaryotic-like serine/threonine-protein kinase